MLNLLFECMLNLKLENIIKRNDKSFVSAYNPNRAEIFSHLIHAGGGGVLQDPPPLSPVIAVINGQK